MTIGAPNLTFRNLVHNSIPGSPVSYQSSYLSFLLAAHMIELERDSVFFVSTVYATGSKLYIPNFFMNTLSVIFK